MAVFVKSIAFSDLERVGEEDARLTANIEWTDSVKAHKSVYVGPYNEKRHDDFELVARQRMWEWAQEMCESQNISVRGTEPENHD